MIESSLICSENNVEDPVSDIVYLRGVTGSEIRTLWCLKSSGHNTG